MSTQSDPIWFVPICCGMLTALSVAASPGLRAVMESPVPGADSDLFAALPANPDSEPGSGASEAANPSGPPDPTDGLQQAPPSIINPSQLELDPDDDPSVAVGSAELPSELAPDDTLPNREPDGPSPERDDALDPPSTRCSFVANDVEVGRAIRRRRVATSETPFESDGRPVFAWFDVTNRDRELAETRVRWHHDGTGHTIESTAPMRAGSHWQFYVEATLPPLMLGNWRVELLDASDCVVTTTTFEVVPMGWRSAAPRR